MLKGIAPCISPELLKTLAEMGHGDEIVLADAHFPGHTFNDRVLRADGLGIATLLDGILPILELDQYAPPLAMMAAVPGDKLDPKVLIQSNRRVSRGGCWRKSPDQCRSAARSTVRQGIGGPWNGFRVAVVAE